MSRSTLLFWAIVGALFAAAAFFAVGAEQRRAIAQAEAAAEAP